MSSSNGVVFNVLCGMDGIGAAIPFHCGHRTAVNNKTMCLMGSFLHPNTIFAQRQRHDNQLSHMVAAAAGSYPCNDHA